MSSLKKLAIRGAIWTIAGYGAGQILRFASNLILTRLLAPEFFGLMALVSTFRIGLELFSDVGIPHSIIQNKRGDDPAFLNTAWTIQVMRGLFLWVVCLLLTIPVAKFYDDQRLLWLLPVVGFTTVIDGFRSTSIFTLQRQMQIGKYTLFELVSWIIQLIAMNVWAWFSPTLAALAIGGLANPLFATIASHRLIPGYTHRFTWDRESAKSIFSFGRWIFVATTLMFLAEQSDRLILGKLLTFEMLGVYSIAFALATIPRQVVQQLSNRVIFPAVSKQADLPRHELRAKIERQRWLILLGAAGCMAVLISFGDLVIGFLYDERYQQATWMMPILCSGIWFSILFYTTSPVLLAIGKPLYSAQSNLFRLLTISIGLPLIFPIAGTIGAIVIIALSDFPVYLVNLYGLMREKLSLVMQDILATLIFVSGLTIILLGRYALGFGFPLDAIL